MPNGTITTEKWGALETVLERDSILFAVLYGSQAIGEATNESDIDIGIQFKPDVDVFTELFRIEEEYSTIGFDDKQLDLTILNEQQEEQFMTTVKEQSVLICGNSESYHEFLES